MFKVGGVLHPLFFCPRISTVHPDHKMTGPTRITKWVGFCFLVKILDPVPDHKFMTGPTRITKTSHISVCRSADHGAKLSTINGPVIFLFADLQIRDQKIFEKKSKINFGRNEI